MPLLRSSMPEHQPKTPDELAFEVELRDLKRQAYNLMNTILPPQGSGIGDRTLSSPMAIYQPESMPPDQWMRAWLRRDGKQDRIIMYTDVALEQRDKLKQVNGTCAIRLIGNRLSGFEYAESGFSETQLSLEERLDLASDVLAAPEPVLEVSQAGMVPTLSAGKLINRLIHGLFSS